jgi:hypothetical protein
MWRWGFNLAAAASLVMCAGTLAFWVRGNHKGLKVSLVITRPTERYAYSASTELGSLEFSYYSNPTGMTLPPRVSWEWYEWMPRADAVAHLRLGFGRGRIFGVPPAGGAWIALPWWIMAVSLAGISIMLLLNGRPRKRPGLRCSCGYDLRASPDRCPECGRLVRVEAKA